MILSSTRQHKTDREGREVTGKMETGKGLKRKEGSKWKEYLWSRMQGICTNKLTNRYRYCLEGLFLIQAPLCGP